MEWFKVMQIKRSIETMRKYGRILGVFFLCSLIISGCGKQKRIGNPAANVPPRVYFTDVPPDSSKFSVNPRVSWYGTDIDGFIVAYQYAVMRCDSLKDFGSIQEVKNFLLGIKTDSASWVDNLTLRNMIGGYVQAEPGGGSRHVSMFAEMNPDSFTAQYLFLRAVDNSGAVSDSTIYKLFYRNNHRPWAIIEADSAFRASNHYCLVDTTITWKGISISWSGKDSLDYPNLRDQPDFKFKWELVGPFESSPTVLTVDTMAVVDSSLDSIYAEGEGKWIYSRWVSEKLHLFKGLENFGDSGYGWYQLRVRTRDDAYVSTDTPTVLNIRILKPKFRYADENLKSVLVVDATIYGGKDGAANVDPAENDQNTSQVRTFYNEALVFLKQEGIFDDCAMWFDPLRKPLDQSARDAPPEDVLSRYDLVIVLNSGSFPAISTVNYAKYQDYINIGGRLWIIGLNNFNVIGDRSDVHPAGSTANSYFGIESVFVPNWTPKESTTVEFVAAEPYGLWETLPYLQIDPAKCQKLKGWDSNVWGRHFDVNGVPYICFDGISNTLDYARRIPSKRRMMSFISTYGSNSIMHEKPCAINYIGSTFRTAEFTFPLELMKNEASDNYPVYEVMKQTIEWFLQDLP